MIEDYSSAAGHPQRPLGESVPDDLQTQCLEQWGRVMDAASILFVIFVIGIGTVALWQGGPLRWRSK
jgi:hypothetical protein